MARNGRTIRLVALMLFRTDLTVIATIGLLLLIGIVTAPLVMPEIITGITQLLLFVSMLQMFAWPHRGFTTIVISHVVFCTAYATITIQSRLQSADRSLEEAAMDLGARPVTGRRVSAVYGR